MKNNKRDIKTVGSVLELTKHDNILIKSVTKSKFNTNNKIIGKKDGLINQGLLDNEKIEQNKVYNIDENYIYHKRKRN